MKRGYGSPDAIFHPTWSVIYSLLKKSTDLSLGSLIFTQLPSPLRLLRLISFDGGALQIQILSIISSFIFRGYLTNFAQYTHLGKEELDTDQAEMLIEQSGRETAQFLCYYSVTPFIIGVIVSWFEGSFCSWFIWGFRQIIEMVNMASFQGTWR